MTQLSLGLPKQELAELCQTILNLSEEDRYEVMNFIEYVNHRLSPSQAEQRSEQPI